MSIQSENDLFYNRLNSKEFTIAKKPSSIVYLTGIGTSYISKVKSKEEQFKLCKKEFTEYLLNNDIKYANLNQVEKQYIDSNLLLFDKLNIIKDNIELKQKNIIILDSTIRTEILLNKKNSHQYDINKFNKTKEEIEAKIKEALYECNSLETLKNRLSLENSNIKQSYLNVSKQVNKQNEELIKYSKINETSLNLFNIFVKTFNELIKHDKINSNQALNKLKHKRDTFNELEFKLNYAQKLQSDGEKVLIQIKNNQESIKLLINKQSQENAFKLKLNKEIKSKIINFHTKKEKILSFLNLDSIQQVIEKYLKNEQIIKSNKMLFEIKNNEVTELIVNLDKLRSKLFISKNNIDKVVKENISKIQEHKSDNNDYLIMESILMKNKRDSIVLSKSLIHLETFFNTIKQYLENSLFKVSQVKTFIKSTSSNSNINSLLRNKMSRKLINSNKLLNVYSTLTTPTNTVTKSVMINTDNFKTLLVKLIFLQKDLLALEFLFKKKIYKDSYLNTNNKIVNFNKDSELKNMSIKILQDNIAANQLKSQFMQRGEPDICNPDSFKDNSIKKNTERINKIFRKIDLNKGVIHSRQLQKNFLHHVDNFNKRDKIIIRNTIMTRQPLFLREMYNLSNNLVLFDNLNYMKNTSDKLDEVIVKNKRIKEQLHLKELKSNRKTREANYNRILEQRLNIKKILNKPELSFNRNSINLNVKRKNSFDSYDFNKEEELYSIMKDNQNLNLNRNKTKNRRLSFIESEFSKQNYFKDGFSLSDIRLKVSGSSIYNKAKTKFTLINKESTISSRLSDLTSINNSIYK